MPETHELPLDVIRKAWDENVKPGAEGDSTGSPWAGVAYLGNEERAVKFARAIVTAARQSDEAGKREAASKAWDAAIRYAMPPVHGTSTDARDRYLDREHPLPARECVRCALCDQSGADLSTGVHATRDECIEALGAALKSFAAGVGR